MLSDRVAWPKKELVSGVIMWLASEQSIIEVSGVSAVQKGPNFIPDKQKLGDRAKIIRKASTW